MEYCPAHSGIEEKFKAIEDRLDDHKKQLNRIEDKLTSKDERLGAIGSEVVSNRNMIYGAYSLIVIVCGWIFYHINK